MNKKSITTAKDDVLSGSQAAMERAAKKAREIAQATRTPLVVNRDGETVLVEPSELNSPHNERPSEEG